MGLLNQKPVAPVAKPPMTRPVTPKPQVKPTAVPSNVRPAPMRPQAAPPRAQAPVPAQRPAPDLRRIFAGGIASAQAHSERAPFIRGGHYILKIVKCGMEETRRGDAYAALDFEVRAVLAVSADGDQPHSVGETVRHAIFRKMESFFEQVKKFVAVAGGGAVDDVDDEDVILVMGEGQPLTGRYVEVMAINNPNKKWAKEGDPTHFTNPSYRRLLSDDEVALLESGGNPAPHEEQIGDEQIEPDNG